MLPSAKSYTGADIGRASKGAAKTLLAKVYLQRAGTGVGTAADWQSALTYARQVQSDGDYSLVADYKSLFDFIGGTVQERNSEVIFDIQCIRANGLGGRISSHVAANATAPFLGASTNGSFEAESIWFHSFRTDDKRRDGTFVLLLEQERHDRHVERSADRDAALRERDAVPAQVPRSLMTGTGAEEPNYIVLRYAEVLLMIAEAANEVAGGPTAEAYTAVNAIRARAGIPRDDARTQPRSVPRLGVQRAAMGAFARGSERLFRQPAQLGVGEGAHRGKHEAREVQQQQVPQGEQSPIADTYKLMPIPQRAIDLNPALKQNPGW